MLADVDAQGVEEIWCLGDMTGYGARPPSASRPCASGPAICLVGNHDLVVGGNLGIDSFTSDAAEAAVLRAGLSSPDERA